MSLFIYATINLTVFYPYGFLHKNIWIYLFFLTEYYPQDLFLCLFNLFLSVCMPTACAHKYTYEFRWQLRPEVYGILGARVTVSCEPLDMAAGNWTAGLKEQQVSLTASYSSSPSQKVFKELFAGLSVPETLHC